MDKLFKINTRDGDIIINIDFLVGLERKREGQMVRYSAKMRTGEKIDLSEEQYFHLLEMWEDYLNWLKDYYMGEV